MSKQIEMFSENLSPDRNCTRCRLHKTAKTVCLLGSGPVLAQAMIVGEAPGATEDEGGKPFIGRAGQLLREVLDEQGINERRVFITNAVSCRPPDNKTPTKGEIKACSVWLQHQMRVVCPKYVLLLGNTPLLSVTGEGGIKKRRGKPFEQDGVIYLPTYHPAFILRDPTQRGIFERDIKLFADIIKRGSIPREDRVRSKAVMNWQQVKELLEALEGTVSFDIETTCLYPWQKKNEKGEVAPAKITMIGFGTKNGEYSIPFNVAGSPWSREDQERIIEAITERLEDCKLVTHNGKFDCLWMWVHYGVKWYQLMHFDTMLAHYLLDENDRHGLKYLAQKYCGAPDWDVDSTTKTGKGSLSKLVMYHAHDLYYTRQLSFILGKLLNKEPRVRLVFRKLMMPIARLFTEVEYDGVYIDESKFDGAETFLRDKYDTALKELKTHADIEWGSPKQLSNLLFGKKRDGGLELPIVEKTAKGAASTSESVLKRIDHPCVAALLRFREAKQQLSFFIEGWKPYFHRTITGVYLHPSFKLHGTVTGRPSCEHPNLQQVPRDERIRSLITAPPGWTLIDADLSQIELRIAAELANEAELLQTFIEGRDPHWLTALREIARGGGKAKEVVGTAHKWLTRKNPKAKPPRYADAIDILLEMGADAAVEIDKGWKELRKKAKAVNFGYLYGMWWKKFKIYAFDNYGVVVTDEEAEASRTAFFDMYPGFGPWHKKQKLFARRNGYVATLTGRKRRLPAAMLPEDSPIRGAAERQAVNSPVQGFAAELNLMVALQLREEFPRSQLRIVGTVHDAILMWARNGYEKKVYDRVQEIMRRPALFDDFDIELKVPVEGEAVLGAWGAGKKWEKWYDAQEQLGRKVLQKDRKKRRQPSADVCDPMH